MPDTPGSTAPVSTPAPAAPVSAPAAPASPMPSLPSGDASFNMDSAIDALLATPEPASSQPDAAGAPAAAPEGGGAAPQEAAPGGSDEPGKIEAPKTEVASPETPTEPEVDELEQPDDDLDAAQVDEAKVQNLLDLKRPRGQRIYGAYKQYKAISEALGGRELTPEEAVQHMQAFSDRVAMEDEFSSPDPGAQVNFLHYWNSKDPQALARMAGVLPHYLAQSGNVGAYNAAAAQFLNRYVQMMYNVAAQEQDPQVKERQLFMTRMLDWNLNNKFRQDTELPQQQDPLASREAALTAREQQIMAANQQGVAARRMEWAQQLYQVNSSALTTEAEKAIAPLKSTLAARQYSAAQKDFVEAVQNHIAKDVEGGRLYDIVLNRALTQLSAQDMQSLEAQWAQRVSRAVRAVAPAFLKEWGVAQKAQNQERHQQLAASTQAGAAPTGTGAPVQQSIVPQQKPGASKAEQMEASIDAILGATGNR